MALQKNVVFVHIPKAGGTSVRELMMSLVAEDEIFPQDDLHHSPRYETLAPDRPKLFMAHLGFDFVRAAGADAIVLMRHPIDRVLSLYSYAMNPGVNAPIIGPEWLEGVTFEDFFTTSAAPMWMNVDNAQVWQIASNYYAFHRKRRMSEGTTIEQIVAEAKANLDASAVVGTVEQMNGFYRSVAAYFGQPDAELPQWASNVTENRIRWDDLTDAQKALVDARVSHEWEVYDHAKAIAARTMPEERPLVAPTTGAIRGDASPAATGSPEAATTGE